MTLTLHIQHTSYIITEPTTKEGKSRADLDRSQNKANHKKDDLKLDFKMTSDLDLFQINGDMTWTCFTGL